MRRSVSPAVSQVRLVSVAETHARAVNRTETAANTRNAKCAKIVRTGEGPVRTEAPHRCDGSFEPIRANKDKLQGKFIH